MREGKNGKKKKISKNIFYLGGGANAFFDPREQSKKSVYVRAVVPSSARATTTLSTAQ